MKNAKWFKVINIGIFQQAALVCCNKATRRGSGSQRPGSGAWKLSPRSTSRSGTGETGGALRACTLPPGRLLLDDTEPQVSDCRLFDHLHWLQLNGCDADVIEQANPLAQEQRHEMKLDFVEESRL